MSIFSTNIIEEPWVGLAYKLFACTDPKYQPNIWNDAFSLNFSKKKLKQKLDELIRRQDGSVKLSEEEIIHLNNYFNSKHSQFKLEYKYLIFICLSVPSLDGQLLSDIFTSCLSKTKSENDNVQVTLENYELNQSFFVSIKIKVNTYIPQYIQISLIQK